MNFGWPSVNIINNNLFIDIIFFIKKINFLNYKKTNLKQILGIGDWGLGMKNPHFEYNKCRKLKK